MQLCRHLAQERGSVAIMAIIVMTLLLVLGGAYITLSSTEVDISTDYRNGVAAQYLAEAGVQEAIVKLKTETDFVTKTGNTTGITTTSATQNEGTPTAGSYKVTVTGSGTTRTITSTGTVGSGRTAAKRQIILNVMPPSSGASGIYSYPVYSATSVIINGGARVELGSAGSSGSVGNNGYVEGGIQPNKSYSFPDFSGINYSSSPQLPQNINGGEKLTNLSGIYYVNSAFNISGDLISATNSTVTIYVKGNVNVNGGAHINGNFRIIANGDIDVNGDINKGILIANGTYNDSHVNGGAHIYGSVITKGKLLINGTVTYDEGLIEAFGLKSGTTFAINSFSNY